jgi:hypothetical protein
MRLDPDIAQAIAITAQRWAEATTDLPLIIRKTADGAICSQIINPTRYSKRAFAKELNMSPNTFRKLEENFGIAPAKSDGCYDAETVADVKRWLRNEETINRGWLNRRFPNPR